MLAEISNSPSFGMCQVKNTEKFIEKEGILAYKKAELAAKEMQNYRFWKLFADEDGYKVYSKKTKKIYDLTSNPRRHAPNSLLIRLLSPANKIKDKVSSFKIEFKNINDVRRAYNMIKHAVGIDRAIIIVKALERQARLQALRKAERKNSLH